MRAIHGIALALALLSAASLAAQEALPVQEPPPAQDAVPAFPFREAPHPGPFSLPGSLPGPTLGYVLFADRPAAPVLAGGAYEAEARGLEPFFAAPIPKGASKEILSSPAGFGGIRESALFAGGIYRLGGFFRDETGPALFFRVDVAASYSKGEGATGVDAGAAGSAGLLGDFPLPWALSFGYDAVVSERSVGKLALEAGGRVLELGPLGALSAFGGVEFSTSFPVLGSSAAAISARGLLEAGRRDWRGAFAQGYAAWLGGEYSHYLGSGDRGYSASAGAEGAVRILGLAGLSGSVSARLASEDRDDWAELLRGVADSSASFAGDTALLSSLELPLLFARGRLLKDERLAVEFTLAPFLDAALVRAAGTGLFEAGNFRCGAGLELSMSIDAERRDSLRVSGGFDLSERLGGAASGDGSVELAAALFIAL